MRTARKLVVLMVEEFQPYGATWAELMHESGMKPTAYKRAFNFATERKWFVGGGGQGKPYYLNPMDRGERHWVRPMRVQIKL